MKKVWPLACLLVFVSCQKSCRDLDKKITVQRGQALYNVHCASCHGVKGDGKGPGAEFLWPRPRDFTTGIYKYRTTRGLIPTDADLLQTMRIGIPGTSMPGWDVLKTDDLRSILAHLKILSPRLKTERQGAVIDIPDEMPATLESVLEGRRLYEQRGCVVCHGLEGKGDGPAAIVLKDIWGDRIAPRDLTQGPLKWGNSARDIYRTLMIGVPGTPMPSFEQTFTKNELWSLVHYLRSIQRPIPEGYDPSHPKRSLLTVPKIGGEIPLDATDIAWSRAPSIPVFLKPLWHEPDSTEWLTAKALHNGNDIAILVSWKDNQPDIHPDRPDAVAIELPQNRVADPADLPYLGTGNPGKPVDVWKWKAPNTLLAMTAAGIQTPTPKEGPSGILGQGQYGNEQWRVIFKRSLTPTDPNETEIFPIGFLAFGLWDGDQPRHAGPQGFSEWIYYELTK